MECDNDEKIFLSYLVGKKWSIYILMFFCQVDVYSSKNLFKITYPFCNTFFRLNDTFLKQIISVEFRFLKYVFFDWQIYFKLLE